MVRKWRKGLLIWKWKVKEVMTLKGASGRNAWKEACKNTSVLTLVLRRESELLVAFPLKCYENEGQHLTLMLLIRVMVCQIRSNDK